MSIKAGNVFRNKNTGYLVQVQGFIKTMATNLVVYRDIIAVNTPGVKPLQTKYYFKTQKGHLETIVEEDFYELFNIEQPVNVRVGPNFKIPPFVKKHMR